MNWHFAAIKTCTHTHEHTHTWRWMNENENCCGIGKIQQQQIKRFMIAVKSMNLW